MKRALAGGNVVWTRGLLRKGCGLCHGTAGGGYALLEIYQATNDPKYLHRAFKVYIYIYIWVFEFFKI